MDSPAGSTRPGEAASSRPLGEFALLALGINGILGVGIFFTPNLVAGLLPGLSSVFAYALTLVVLLPVAACYAKLGARFDRDGGPYVWASSAFGARAGFVVGFAAYASAVLSTATVFAGLAEYVAPALGFGASKRLFSISVVSALAAVVALGLKPSAWLWSWLTLLKLAPLVILIGVFLSARPSAFAPAQLAASSSSWGRAVLLLVFPLQGFEIVPVPGSRVRDPERAIPLATLGSLAACAGLYMLLQWACVRHVSDLARESAPLIAAGRSLGGARLSALVSVGADISALGIAFGMMAMTPRYLSALGAGNAASRIAIIGRESRNQVPRMALFATLCSVVVLLSVGALAGLFVLSSVAVLFQYSVSVASLAVLAFKREHGLARRDALTAALALGALAVVALAVERRESLVMLGILVLALVLSFFAEPKRTPE